MTFLADNFNAMLSLNYYFAKNNNKIYNCHPLQIVDGALRDSKAF